ncbi:MAG: YraN family protein, partial [Bryobacteraceae bacterium]
RGEDLAHRHLRRRGCTIVARNYRPPTGGGEVDLIVWKDGVLVFVEVKSRASDEFGAPDRAVDGEKQQSLIRVARDCTRRARIDWSLARFDVVSVILSHPPRLEWIVDAFSKNANGRR